MSLLKSLRTVMVCALLEVGLLSGAPMRAEQIQDLMHQLNQPKLAHALPGRTDEGDDPPEPAGVEPREGVS